MPKFKSFNFSINDYQVTAITLQMFADHESSLNPIDVPRSLIWNLPRRIVYFGTSVSSIFKGTRQD
jgi:hypothetical protein